MMFLAAAACRPGNEAAPVPAIDLSNLDTTVAPGDDFYAYATAGWQRNHPLKAEYSRYGSFDIAAPRITKSASTNSRSLTASRRIGQRGAEDCRPLQLIRLHPPSTQRVRLLSCHYLGELGQ